MLRFSPLLPFSRAPPGSRPLRCSLPRPPLRCPSLRRASHRPLLCLPRRHRNSIRQSPANAAVPLRPRKETPKDVDGEQGLSRCAVVACPNPRNGAGWGEAAVAAALRNYGVAALHQAAAEGNIDVCRYLVEDVGLDVDVRGDLGETPLFHAAFYDRVDVTRYLLNHGADPTMVGQAGSPLHGSAVNGNCEIVRLLLSRGVNVDIAALPGAPLHLAAGYGQDGTVKILLEHQANPNLVANADNTPLSMAIWSKSLDCVKLLIKGGADVNFVYSTGMTYVMMAAVNGLTDIMKCLLEAGADPNIPDEFGRTPIEVAALQGRREDVETLFPLTSHVSSFPDWSVDGIISQVKSHGLKPIDKRRCELKRAELKLQAKKAFMNKDYLTALTLYNSAFEIGPSNDDDGAALLADRSFCWLRLEDGENALADADACRILRPHWPKACYRQGSALMLLQVYDRAWQLFAEGLKLDPRNVQIHSALRGAVEARKRRTPTVLTEMVKSSLSPSLYCFAAGFWIFCRKRTPDFRGAVGCLSII